MGCIAGPVILAVFFTGQFLNAVSITVPGFDMSETK